MTSKATTLSGEILDKIFDHVSSTGKPLLRRTRRSDVAHISAWLKSDGSYELVDTELNDFLNGCDSWEDLAAYCGQDVMTVAAHLEKAGYPWPLPQEGDDREDWGSLDPFEAAAYLRGVIPLSYVQRIRTLIPPVVRWDGKSRHPEIPRSVQAALEWLGGNGSVTMHDECWEMRGGSPSHFVEVPSAVALSCLQVALDQVEAGVRLEVQ